MTRDQAEAIINPTKEQDRERTKALKAASVPDRIDFLLAIVDSLRDDRYELAA